MSTLDSIELASVTGGQSLKQNLAGVTGQARNLTAREYLQCVRGAWSGALGTAGDVGPLPVLEGRAEVMARTAEHLDRNFTNCATDNPL